MSANRFDASRVAVQSQHVSHLTASVVLLLVWSFLLVSHRTHAQAPGLLWATNIGARVFAVDAQTNVYANAGGTVIVLNSAGVPLQTNAICPRPALAARDADGSYYFTGLLPSHIVPGLIYLEFEPQDFGGVTLSNSPVFLVKYSAAGTLLWATNFGQYQVIRGIAVTDLVLDSDGNILLSYTHFTSTINHSPFAAKFKADGSQVWTAGVPKYAGGASAAGTVKLTSAGPSDGYALHYIGSGLFQATLSRFDANGQMSVMMNWPTPYEAAAIAPRAVVNSFGALHNAEGRTDFQLTKRQASGAVIWQLFTGYDAQRVVGPDQFDGVHVATDTGQLTRYDYDGNWIWSMNLPSNCEDLILGPQGNRFLTLSGGSVARLAAEALAAPAITNAPQGQTVLAGSDPVFNVGATGTTPLRYYWQLEGAGLLNATNSTLTLSNVTVAQAGNYQVVVSNHVGSITSSPALLRIKHLAIFDGDQLLTSGTHVFSSPPTLTIRSTYANGSAFYTLDGSAPGFASTYYSGPFVLPQSATVRAIGYSADFSQTDEADAVNAVVLANHTLTTTATSGGTVSLNPPGGTYLATDIVTATASPASGWYFLYWQADASGPYPTINVSMERDKALHAVFGTILSTTVTGNGSVQVFPPGGVYALGTTLRLTAIPQPGYYFGFWGNASTGNTNPLYFTISGPNQTVSSIFAPLPADQSALTVLVNGHGSVTANPRANAYPTNQSVTLTAVPDEGQSFVNWSGDASGSQNPLVVSMAQSRVITANFSSRPWLRVDRPGVEGFTPAGFRFTVVSDPQTAHDIRASTNLVNWVSLGRVTNDFGEVQFTDTNAISAPARFYQAAP